MTRRRLKLFVAAAVLVPVAALAQRANIFGPNPAMKAPEIPTTATVITKEEIDTVNKAQQVDKVTDENIKVAGLGYENMSLGIIHRGATAPRPAAGAAPAGGGGERANATPCGQQMNPAPADAVRGAITHDFQTEAYYIISGGGEMFTDGTLINGRHVLQDNAGGPNGPTCDGMAVNVKKRTVKVGDVVIVPAGVVHGWSNIPDHVDYLSFRPSQMALQAGWINPHIK